MLRMAAIAGAALFGLTATAALAQHGSASHSHGQTAAPADSRQALQFPPEMQVNFLGNMRDHMQTIDAILRAVAENDLGEASRIAATRLGLDSPSAAGCKPSAVGTAGAAPPPPAPGSMDEMMALYMPEAMRAVGLSMHTAASEFAVVVAKADATHDTSAVAGALAKVTQNCVACHSAYRIR